MAKKPPEYEPHLVVPGPWVEKIRGDWPQAAEFEVEFRSGTRGSWRPVATVPKVELVSDDSEEKIDAGEARSYAQTLFDKAWAHRETIDTRCDYRLRSWGLGKKDDGGRVEVGTPEARGGRLDSGRSEDVPDDGEDEAAGGVVGDERRSFVTTIKSLCSELRLMSRAHVELLDTSSSIQAEANRVRNEHADVEQKMEKDRLDAHVQAYRAEQAKEFGDKFINQMAPGFNAWAQARYQEAFTSRKRKPRGDSVLDSLGEVADALDYVTAQKFADIVGADVWTDVHLLITGVDGWTAAEVVRMWGKLRKPLTPHWSKLMDSAHQALRVALSNLGNAVEAAEQAA